MRYTQPQSGPLNTTVPLRVLFNAPTFGQQGGVAVTTNVAWKKVATPHGIGLQGGYASSAVTVFPDSGGSGNQQAACNTQHFVFIVLSNAAQEGIASVGLSSTDGSPRSLLQNNAGMLRVYDSSIGYTNMEAAVIGKRYVFSIVYSDFSPYVTSYYLNGRFIASANNYRSGTTWRTWLGTGFPTASVNAAILLYTGRAGVAETAAEVAAYAANPWSVFVTPQRRLLAAASSGPGTPDPISGTFASTESADSLTAAGALRLVPISGALAATEAPDTLAASGSAAFSAINGSFASTEAPDMAAGAGTVTWNPISGLFAATESADSLTASGTVALPAITGTFAATEGADTLASGNVAPMVGGGGGGSGGSVRDVRAFAAQLDKASRQTKSHKKQVRRALETEALALLPDEPAAKEIAPLLAALVAREQAPLLAAWQPVRALMPVALPHAAEAQLMALAQQWQAERAAAEWAANDEYETELLLLGAA